MAKRIDFDSIAQRLKEDLGNDYGRPILTLGFPDPRALLWEGLQHFCKDARWLAAYDAVVEWMGDSKGKGLCLLGPCGVGKTVICSKILPVLLNLAHRMLQTFVATDMNRVPDKVLDCPLKVIDDIGTEGVKVEYGERRMVFAEVVDKVERCGQFLVVTSNLTPEEIEKKYGERTFDRLRAVTQLITITGESMRL